MFHVNVYELDSVYGGPEEGGWWVTTGKPVKDQCRTAPTMEAAVRIRDEIEAGFVKPYYSLSSVMYAGGEFAARIEDGPAKAFPDRFPHYE